MAKKSAGLLVYRRRDGAWEILLVHPGGPFWAGKDAHAWSIPKGEYADDEEPFAAARREFTEETGLVAEGEFIPLAPVKQPGGKIVTAWAIEADPDISNIKSNTFTVEWPPHSGRVQEFPEIDKAQWFAFTQAREKINKGQIALLDQLEKRLTAESQ